MRTMTGMGSTRQDIYSAIDAFADHCDRQPLDRRPTYFAQYIDLWNEPKGEIGICNPTDIDEPRRDVEHTAFALLTPWLAIPTMAQAWLVIDRLESLWVVSLVATNHGYFGGFWAVPYRMEDDGSITCGEPLPQSLPAKLASPVASAKKGRMEQRLWDVDYDIKTIMPAVEHLLENGQ